MGNPLSGAQYLSEDRRARWLIENSPRKLQIARLWPFLGVAGSGLMFARENTALSPTLQAGNVDHLPDPGLHHPLSGLLS